jgi:hypothetical protein
MAALSGWAVFERSAAADAARNMGLAPRALPGAKRVNVKPLRMQAFRASTLTYAREGWIFGLFDHGAAAVSKDVVPLPIKKLRGRLLPACPARQP